MKRIKTISAIVVALFTLCFMAGLFTSCQKKPTPKELGFPVTVRDSFGNEIEIKTPPKRVICLSPEITENVYALHYYDIVAGVSDDSNYPDGALVMDRMGTAVDPDVNKIIEKRPDLVLTAQKLPDTAMEKLEANNIRVVVVGTMDELDGLSGFVTTIGTIIGGSNKGVEEAEDLLARVNDRFAQLMPKEPKYKIYLALRFGSEGMFTATPDTLPGEILAKTGLINVADGMKNYEFSSEKLKEADPDAIFVMAGQRDLFVADLANQQLRAVQEDHVYEVDSTAFVRLTGRVAEAAEAVYYTMYPMDEDEDLEE